MASHHQPYSNVVHLWDQPLDYERRPKLDLYDTFEERARIARVIRESRWEARKIIWQTRIAVACYVLAVLTGMYFAFQLGRGVL